MTPEELEQNIKNAKAALAAIVEIGENAKIALAEANAKLAEIASVATQAVAVKTQIADQQAIIAAKSDHIQKAQEHADTVRANLDRALTAATQQATEAEGLKSRTQSAADSSTELLANIPNRDTHASSVWK